MRTGEERTHVKEVVSGCKGRGQNKTPRIARDKCYQQLSGGVGTAAPWMVRGVLGDRAEAGRVERTLEPMCGEDEAWVWKHSH